MLQKYIENPWENWRDKDTVLYLVTSLASKGQTQRDGTTQTNELVDLTSFATEHILPELQKDTGMSITKIFTLRVLCQSKTHACILAQSLCL
jgi:hypothetical protein